jgi:hypothetical protein
MRSAHPGQYRALAAAHLPPAPAPQGAEPVQSPSAVGEAA